MIICKIQNTPTPKDKEILEEILDCEVIINFIENFYHKDFYSLLKDSFDSIGGGESLLLLI
ncbi:MAG: hypothetical protein J1E31_04890 [Helicobacter sp.]|nr:hypothetical protein [Helicobacter sp.]